MGGRPWVRLLVGVVLAAVLVAGCSDDGDEGVDSPSPTGDLELDAVSSFHVVSQNILHGEACPADSDKCHLPDRMAFFAQQLGDSCPDLVGVQEANQRIVDELRRYAEEICDGKYTVLWDDDAGTDREVVLSAHPVLAEQRFELAGPLRTALWVRVATGAGAVDFWTTHLASGSDNRPCDDTTCPPPCKTDDDLNTCQGRQVVALAQEHRAPDSPLVIGGDLNAEPGSRTIEAMVDAGFVDTHLAADNEECDPERGSSCTGGRDDSSVEGLSDPEAQQKERIDYLLLGGASRCKVDTPTGLFEAMAASGREDGLAHPSDHTGVQATVQCETSEAQREAGAKATTSSTTTTTVAPGSVDEATEQGVVAAFEAVFSGTSDLDERVAAIENGESVRSVVVEGFASNEEIASRITVDVSDVRLPDPGRAEVTFSLLLDGNAVLDHLPGIAVLEEGRWLVSTQTFCEVGTQGMTELPPACS